MIRNMILKGSNSWLIVFVGPQASGKTTQAKPLQTMLKSNGASARVTRLVYYTLFHMYFIRFSGILCRLFSKKCVMVKFYEDLPPRLSPSPEMLRRLFWLLVVLYILGLFISFLKLRFLNIFSSILIEDEGFVFKQLADLLYLARRAGLKTKDLSVKASDLSTFALSIFIKLLFGTLSSINSRMVVVHLKAEPECLKPRFRTRAHIELPQYLAFQESVYREMIRRPLCFKKVLEIDACRSTGEVRQRIIDGLRDLLTGEILERKGLCNPSDV